MENEINSPTVTGKVLPCAKSAGGGAAGVSTPEISAAPTCFTCNLALSRCSCPYPGDDEMMPAGDVVRIMGLLYPELEGWALAEKSALGMVKP